MNYTHLTRYSNLPMVLKPHRALRAIRVVKYDGHTGLGNASLSPFVNEVLLVGCAHLRYTMTGYCYFLLDVTYRRHVGDTEDETYRV